MDYYREREKKEPIDLCYENGKLNLENIGWSRQCIYNCNLSGNFLRKKKWNYFCMIGEKSLFSVTISNIDYLGMVFLYLYDFDSKKYVEKTIASPFGKGCNMTDNLFNDIEFIGKDINVKFLNEDKNTRIKIYGSDFGGEKIDAEFLIEFPKEHETLNVVIPWSENRFQFTSKQNCLPIDGKLNALGKEYKYEKNKHFASLDFGRGVWPYNTMWNWATLSGKTEGKIFGINLGAKWTDGTGYTENALILEGKITKLSEDIDFNYDKKDIMKPWYIKSKISDRVDLIFEPMYKRTAKTNAVIIKSVVYQMIGKFSGIIKCENGEVVIKNIIGCAEEHNARW